MFSTCRGGFGGRGVTLIEVIVIIAVIATLAGLLLPVFVQSRGRAQATTCATNLKNLYQAFAMYAQDNDGRLPPYQNQIGISVGCDSPSCGGHWTRAVPEHGKELVSVLKPYTKSDGLWFCPADPFARTDSEEGHIKHRYASYKAHPVLGKQAVIGDKATLEGYVSDPRINPKPVDDVAHMILLDENLWPYLTEDSFRPPYSHQMTFNYLYFDGHVKSLQWKEAH
jgi:prepilin-type processing-associated H-X9-DG protein